jgi:hypothetical protein
MPQTTTPTMGTIATITLQRDKECKGSIRYATSEEGAVITNVYLSRTAYNPMPAAITLTVQVAVG